MTSLKELTKRNVSYPSQPGHITHAILQPPSVILNLTQEAVNNPVYSGHSGSHPESLNVLNDFHVDVGVRRAAFGRRDNQPSAHSYLQRIGLRRKKPAFDRGCGGIGRSASSVSNAGPHAGRLSRYPQNHPLFTRAYFHLAPGVWPPGTPLGFYTYKPAGYLSAALRKEQGRNRIENQNQNRKGAHS